MPGGKPERVVRPNVLAGALISSLWAVGGVVVLVAILLFAAPEIPNMFVFGGGVLLLLGVEVVIVGNLKSRRYRFFGSEVEVYEGFINLNQNNISYDRVTDISYNQPILQRLFGTGTIKLNTAGGGMHEINISYVDNPDQEYERLRSIVWEGRPEGRR